MINIYVYICTISISTVCLIDNYYIDDINYCHNKIMIAYKYTHIYILTYII